MIEKRKAKMVVTKGGSGSSTFRATIPATWIRQMGLSEDNRNLKLEFDGESITIKNNEEEIKMLKSLLERAKVEIEKEMEEVGYIDDSDNADRFLDSLARGLVEEKILQGNDDIDLYYEKEGEIEELATELLGMIKEYIGDTYNVKGAVNSRGDYAGCYFKKVSGLVKWSGCWEENSIQEAYEEFINLYSVDITLEDYAKAYDVDIEDYI